MFQTQLWNFLHTLQRLDLHSCYITKEVAHSCRAVTHSRIDHTRVLRQFLHFSRHSFEVNDHFHNCDVSYDIVLSVTVYEMLYKYDAIVSRFRASFIQGMVQHCLRTLGMYLTVTLSFIKSNDA